MDQRDAGNAAAGKPDPFTRKTLIVVGITVSVILVLLFLREVAGILLIIFAGVLLAVILSGLARRLSERTPLAYGWSLLVVVILLVGVLGLAGWLIAPSVAAQMDQLGDTLPASLDQFEQQISQYKWGAYLVERVPAPSEMMGGGGRLLSRVTGFFSTALGVLANILLIIALGIYFAVNPGIYTDGIVKLVPPVSRARARQVLQDTGNALWGWLTAQLISMTIIGILTWLGLMLLGIPLALSLGFIAGILEFIPLLGPFLSAVPAILFAFTIGPTQALYVALLYLGIQQLESNAVMPLVMKQVVELPPALTLTAAVLAGALLGVPGVLLATPLLVVVVTLVEKLYVEDVLGDASGDKNAS